MRGAGTLIPARFLTLIGHFCVLVTLLWESQASVRHCLPTQFHESHLEVYHNRLVAGLATSIALIIAELITFVFGLTMFSPSVSLISIGGHGFATISLTLFILDGWLCDWFWPIFVFCSILPSLSDLTVASTKEQEQLTGEDECQGGWSFYLVLAGVATTLGSSLPVGFNIGVINTPAEIIKSFCNESVHNRYGVELSEGELSMLWSSVVSIFIVGGCVGSVFGATLANRFGRKDVTIGISFLSLAGAALFLGCRAADSIEMLILGRFIVGLAGGLTTSIVPMYLTELAPAELTGAVGVACPMGVNVGVLVSQVMGLEFLLGKAEDWPYLLSVYSLLVVVCLPALCILPESPKYLYVIKKDENTAIKELSRVRGAAAGSLAAERRQLAREAGGARAAGWSLLEAARCPPLRRALLLVCLAAAAQQTSGINAVFYYSQTIFSSAGLSAGGSQLATVACGAVNVCTAAAMPALLPRAGRRPLLLASLLAAAALLAALTASLLLMHLVPWMSYVSMFMVIAYVFVYGFGLGPIPYFIASEMLEVGPRPAGMAWGSLSNWAGNFLVGMTFPLMRAHIGAYSFLVFSAITTCVFVYFKLYFPETRGRTPAEVTQITSSGRLS